MACIWFTLLSWSWTAEQSPPQGGLPQATTCLPPQHHKANAVPDLATWACCTTAVRCSLSWTPAVCKETKGLARTCPSIVTSFRKPRPRAFCASSFKSPTVESSGSERVSQQPLGSKILTRSIWQNIKWSPTQNIVKCTLKATFWAKGAPSEKMRTPLPKGNKPLTPTGACVKSPRVPKQLDGLGENGQPISVVQLEGIPLLQREGPKPVFLCCWMRQYVTACHCVFIALLSHIDSPLLLKSWPSKENRYSTQTKSTTCWCYRRKGPNVMILMLLTCGRKPRLMRLVAQPAELSHGPHGSSAKNQRRGLLFSRTSFLFVKPSNVSRTIINNPPISP